MHNKIESHESHKTKKNKKRKKERVNDEISSINAISSSWRKATSSPSQDSPWWTAPPTASSHRAPDTNDLPSHAHEDEPSHQHRKIATYIQILFMELLEIEVKWTLIARLEGRRFHQHTTPIFRNFRGSFRQNHPFVLILLRILRTDGRLGVLRQLAIVREDFRAKIPVPDEDAHHSNKSSVYSYDSVSTSVKWTKETIRNTLLSGNMP